MIKWYDDEAGHGAISHGYVQRECKYFVGYWSPASRMIADVKISQDEWANVNIPVSTIEEGKQICEMWEATGAY